MFSSSNARSVSMSTSKTCRFPGPRVGAAFESGFLDRLSLEQLIHLDAPLGCAKQVHNLC
jgi:hypothetical protein